MLVLSQVEKGEPGHPKLVLAGREHIRVGPIGEGWTNHTFPQK